MSIASIPAKAARDLLAALGAEKAGGDSHWPSNAALEALARDYLHLAATDRPRLGQLGAVCVTTPAMEAFAAQLAHCGTASRRVEGDRARQLLTELSLDAVRAADGSWRRRTGGLDLIVRAELRGRIVVVTQAAVRPKTWGHRS